MACGSHSSQDRARQIDAAAAGFTTAVYSHAVEAHGALYTPLLHAALLVDHSAHYAQWEQEALACLVALLLDRDQRERER